MAQRKQDKLIEYVVWVAAGYFLVINPILKKLGIKKSQAEIAPDIIAPSNNVWSGKSYLQSFGKQKVRLLTSAAKQKYAQAIYDALPTFGNDDSSTIIGIFRSINAKTQVADLAEYFRNKYKYDLFDFLKHGRSRDFFWSSTTGGLNIENINTVLTIVNAKPNK
jgi:hypothetical protein